MKKNIVILGSTGSIGKNAVKVVLEHKKLFKIIALSTNTNIELLFNQAKLLNPEFVVVCDEDKYSEFKKDYAGKLVNTEILFGKEGLETVSSLSKTDLVLNAVVGFAGLSSTITALRHNKVCALANKESIVTGGEILKKIANDFSRQIIPVDSEHSAIHSLLRRVNKNDVSKLIITASGGPFRELSIKELEDVTVEQALSHPNWSMGSKISVDSATMMNKGFEVIEAHHLFEFDYKHIDAVIHKESIIHSMIECIDGEIYAQLGPTDMKFPIQNALTFPNILSNTFDRLNFGKLKSLTFAEIDYDKYPLLKIAYECGKSGGTYPTVLNASNEVAVNEFIKGKIKFTEIYKVISNVLDIHNNNVEPTIKDIINVDISTRKISLEIINKL